MIQYVLKSNRFNLFLKKCSLFKKNVCYDYSLLVSEAKRITYYSNLGIYFTSIFVELLKEVVFLIKLLNFRK